MIHVVTRGMLLWIDAFEALALFGIAVVLFHSITTEPTFRLKRESQSIVREIELEMEEEDEGGADAGSGTVTSGIVIGGDTELTELSSSGRRSSSAPPPQSAFTPVSTKVPVKATFTRCFAWYGLFVGLLALTDFVADVLRFLNWKLFGSIAMATNILLGVIFLPIWLLCLARQLPEATERFEREEKRASILLNANGEEIATLIGNNEREMS